MHRQVAPGNPLCWARAQWKLEGSVPRAPLAGRQKLEAAVLLPSG